MRPKRFSYSHGEAVQDVKGGLPFVPITLTYRDQAVQVSALVDSGSTVNVLPYDVGVQPFSPVRLVIVWTRKTSEEVRVILGPVNFFQEFKVSFDGKAQTFDLLPNR